MRNISLCILIFITISLNLKGEEWVEDSSPRMTYGDYIAKYSPIAVKHMKEYGIPASITLAQGLLESGAGNSDLARNANNHFGIKCHKDWTGDTYHKDDDAVNECFRKYKNPEESFRDHALFLTTRSRYAALFELPPGDYKAWAHGLKAAGYATNPAYADRLISLIERYELHQYDTGMKKKKTRIGRKQQGGGKDKVPAASTPVTTVRNREISVRNGIRFTVAQQGDNLQRIGDDLDIRPWMLRNYNDLDTGGEIRPGEIVYLQGKKRRGKEALHIVKTGETFHSISQEYGIRLQRLIRINKELPEGPPKEGTSIRLR
ncbi:MAG: glucosaminidase domain-containing protein [Bacteroidales bacterium]